MILYTTAVILSAGNSTRMKSDKNKQFIEIGGKEVIAHTLLKFQSAQTINSIVIVCRKAEIAAMSDIVNRERITKVFKIVQGGETRQRSVSNGIAACADKTTHFAIHDGARPFVSAQLIDTAVKAAAEKRACALGVWVKDTIKVVDNVSRIIETPDRSTLVSVQTPQVFEKALYLDALEKANSEAKEYTDDCQLIESLGQDVYIIEGDYKNIKITTPDDIIVGELYMKN